MVANTIPRKEGKPPFQVKDFLPPDPDESPQLTDEQAEFIRKRSSRGKRRHY